MISTLSDKDALELLRSCHLARLACVINDEPYVVPINYRFENDFIYSHSLPGMKIEGLRRNPRACVQVDEIKSNLFWRSVLALGNYEEVVDPAERMVILMGLLKEFPLLTPVESAVAEDVYLPNVIVFRIRIDRITGVSEGVESDESVMIKDSASEQLS